MFDVALLLASQPVPAGNRVSIVTNAIDPGRLATAALPASGLVPAALSAATADALHAAGIPPVRAPGVVDLRPTATPGDYLAAMSAALADPAVDAVLAIFLPPLVQAVDEVASAMVAAATRGDGKTVLASFMSESGLPSRLRDGDRAIPSYVFPERAVAALGRAAAHGRWRREPAGLLACPPGVDQKAARDLLRGAAVGWLSPDDAAALLRHYGFAVPGSAATEADNPPGHQWPGQAGRGVLRVRSDLLAGPAISFGLAGLFSEVFGDTATGVAPLTDRDASALLTSLRAYPLLTGAYGHEPGDVPAIEDALLRLSALTEDLPEVAEIIIDPLLIGRPGQGVVAVSPSVRISPRRQAAQPSASTDHDIDNLLIF
jgi:acyl-CoA synthetase (NDP forming)